MNCCMQDDEAIQNSPIKKIPRPPNAFMLFANANRKIMAQKHPTESNKDISKRLGNSWKDLDSNEKNKFFDRARAIDFEHKKKYPNYVYNPKEARIRKAMREATRDRSIGASPMLPRPGGNGNGGGRGGGLPPPQQPSAGGEWTQPHHRENQLMMCPMDGMRRMDSQLCSYPLASPESNQYIPPMNGYNKMDSSSMMPNYMQPSPLAQLQQQTEMWHPYQDNMRPRSLGTPFHHTMMPEIQQHSPYQDPVQETATNLIMEKPRQSPACATSVLPDGSSPLHVPEEHTLTPPLSVNNNINGNNNCQSETHQHPAIQPNQTHYMDAKISQEGMHQAAINNHENRYMSVPDQMMSCNSYDTSPKVEQPVTKKEKTHPSSSVPGSIYASNFSDKYQHEYIHKYFSEIPDYCLMTINCNDGVNFLYATVSPNRPDSTDAFLEISNVNVEPKLIPTDIGYIPVFEDDFMFDNCYFPANCCQ